MLPTASSFKADLLTLPPTQNKAAGIAAFVGKVADFCNEVQAGATGSPGILTFGNAAMIAAMMSMPIVSDDSWKSLFADAFESGILTGVILPGTTIQPPWLGSIVDVATLPSPAATITTIPLVKSTLLSGLSGATSDAPLSMATAIRDAMLQISFLCIGLGPPPLFVPIPIPISAQ